MNPNAPLIYLDNNATTQVDPAVVEEMLPYLTKFYGNPSSAYRFGKQVGDALELARERVSRLLDCEPSEVLFTSCGTESTNTAIHAALSIDRDRQHIVTTRVEHSATLKTCELLAKRGYEITWLGVNSLGQIDLDELEAAIRTDTALVSIMWANNETGTMFPMDRIREIIRAKGVLFHSDAVQVIGKLPVRLKDGGIHFASLSGHKLHCPKGVGVLYVNRRSRFSAYMTGGGQENSRRAGTENVASIVGLGKACELAAQNIEREAVEVKAMRDQFEQSVGAQIVGVRVNGDAESRLPNTSNLAFEGIDSEALLMMLDDAGICCSAGSACTTGSLYPSHVLKAMGFTDCHARSSLRFSFGRFNSESELERTVAVLKQSVEKLRPLVVA